MIIAIVVLIIGTGLGCALLELWIDRLKFRRDFRVWYKIPRGWNSSVWMGRVNAETLFYSFQDAIYLQERGKKEMMDKSGKKVKVPELEEVG